MEPRPVVLAIVNEWRNELRTGSGARSTRGADDVRPSAFPAETVLHFAGPQMDGVAAVVRLENVVIAVLIQIHESQPIIAPLVVEHGTPFGQRVAGGFPLLLFLAPRKNVAVYEEFARA